MSIAQGCQTEWHSERLPVSESRFYSPLGIKRWCLLLSVWLEKCSGAKGRPTSAPALRDLRPLEATGDMLIFQKRCLFYILQNYFWFETKCICLGIYLVCWSCIPSVSMLACILCFFLLTHPLQHGLQLPFPHPLGDVLQGLCVI